MNAAARNLAAGKSSILGLVISDIRNPFFPEVTTAFQDQALLHDLDAIVFNTNYDAHRTRSCVNRLLALQVSGVAVLTSQIDDSVIGALEEKRVCAVYLDLGRVSPYISNIVIDYEKGIGKALEHLRELGHQQIGFIGGPPQLNSAQRRKRAFLESAADGGAIVGRTVDSDFTAQGGYFACAKLANRSDGIPGALANDFYSGTYGHGTQGGNEPAWWSGNLQRQSERDRFQTTANRRYNAWQRGPSTSRSVPSRKWTVSAIGLRCLPRWTLPPLRLGRTEQALELAVGFEPTTF